MTADTPADARPTSAVLNNRAATIQKTMPSAELATVDSISANGLRRTWLARARLAPSARDTGGFNTAGLYVGDAARQRFPDSVCRQCAVLGVGDIQAKWTMPCACASATPRARPWQVHAELP